MLYNNLKFIFRHSIIFFFVSLIGMTLHEFVRKTKAKSLGYESVYGPSCLGQLVFASEKMQAAFQPIHQENLEAIRSNLPFKDEDKWKKLVNQDKKDHALIELSGFIFTISISLAGLILLFARRKYQKKTNFTFIDWLGVYLSLFIMKELITSLSWITLGFMPCEHAKFYQYFHLPIREYDWIILSFCLFIVLFTIIMFVPKRRIIPFLIAGLTGGSSGIIIWYFYFGKFVFQS